MKKIIMILIAVALLVGTSSTAFAHSGRTDKRGGHNCSAKSKQKGLCTGYHYHKKK
ncbi:YHYH domain-containing protein [Cohnella pontilimi]|uniref:YHYH domain-containing protein n=1 Tax=Cohnella pontilimi TaxID=2564100 RepID=A0A4U0FFS8_9BACL|nr:YHYH domain-containing protein [Cohnella pontilimi]TJY43836.1 YHYH domain-containing protein [Cohnella pontilimi]